MYLHLAIYTFVGTFFVPELDTEYGFLSKMLHHIALGSRVLPEASFDLECTLYAKNRPECKFQPHVFIAGLARAGTTILMRSLYKSNEFSSLTYRDMPFVLAPNTWAKLSSISNRRAKAKERAHGDGVFVDFDSPEALEEVFWRTFTQEDYVQKDVLMPYKVAPDIIKQYRQYIALITHRYGKDRYLCKNNNNILRIPSLLKAFPNATVLIPFREPLEHANSLLKQHQLFKGLHQQDMFTKQYMGWLVHHEFGGDHRPFKLGRRKINYSPDSINYWLNLWVETYSYLLEMYKNTNSTINENVIFVGYELLCTQTNKVWSSLQGHLNIMGQYPVGLVAREQKVQVSSKDLIDEARSIEASLTHLSESKLL